MNELRHRLKLLSLALALTTATSATAAEPYSCRCSHHNSNARGYAPCAKAETIQWCEIVFSDVRLLDPATSSRVTDWLGQISNVFSISDPYSPLNGEQLLIRKIPPSEWTKEEGAVRDELLTFAALPLLLNDQALTLEDITGTLKILDTNMNKILNVAGNADMIQIAPSIRAGSGCVEITNQALTVMINSGWYVEHYDDGWDCAKKE